MEHLWTPWRMTYLQSDQPRPDGCIFCAVVSTSDDDEGNLVLHRGQQCFIILNLYPYNNGHLMIAPFAHSESIEQLPVEALTEMMTLSQKCLNLLRQAYSPQAFNVGINIGTAAGAGVPGHVHLHIVPRWAGDTNFMSALANTRIIPEELPQTYQRLRRLWQAAL
ncbi:MAG: HIT domain-containing protein [Chloroflexi bacterium]|nr:HIT domain-containing protein [Chloroflexota bacterium]